VQVVSGRATITTADGVEECGAGTLVMFEPGERHSLQAHEETTLLLLLAPWPAPKHYDDAEREDAQELPPNASVEPRAQGDATR
jgi:quercetin dioxygenase-like cupin family protein